VVEAEQLTLAQAEAGAEVGHELVAAGQAIADAAEFGGLPRDDEPFGPCARRGARACWPLRAGAG